jgi:hypothetical protein
LNQPFEFNNQHHTVNCIEGKFLLVWALQTSHAASTMHSGYNISYIFILSYIYIYIYIYSIY